MKNCYNLQHIGMVLMIFMMPSEVYCILDILVARTKEIFANKQQDECHWYVCLSSQDYVMQVSMFMQIYMESTFFKKRSLLNHCMQVHFDMTQLVDNCMRFFMSDFLTFNSLIEFTFIFLSDGIYALYRYIYAVLKANKLFIKTLDDPSSLLKVTQSYCKSNCNSEDLKSFAFKFHAKQWRKVCFHSIKVDSNVKEVVRENSKDDPSGLHLPREKLNSKIISYDLYVSFWQFLPEFMRIRSP